MDIVNIDYADCLIKHIDLMHEHWAETGFDFPFEPDIEMYRAMQDNGTFVGIGSFDGDKLIAYSTVNISRHYYNPKEVWCMSDALFVSKPYRKTGLGIKLVETTERVAKALGATRMFWHTTAGSRIEALYARKGYKRTDVMYMKEF